MLVLFLILDDRHGIIQTFLIPLISVPDVY